MVDKKLDPASVAKRLKTKRAKARMDDLRDSLVEKYGGMEGFAEKCLETFEKAKPGSLAKATMLRMVTDVIKLTHKRDPETAVEEFDDKELDDAIEREMEKVILKTPIVELQGAANGTPPQQ